VCGYPARLFDAGDVIVGHTLEVLLRPGHTLDDLRTYEEVVGNLRRDLSNDELSAEEAPEWLRRKAPELAKLADVLPKTRSELYAFLGLILAAITLYVTIRGDGPQEVHIRADELNVNPDRVIDRYVAQENEGSWPARLRSRRDAVKALVTAYVMLREVRNAMEEILPLFLRHPDFTWDEEDRKAVTQQVRSGQRRMRQLADQVQRVSDRLGQPPYEWLPEATGDKVRICVQRFMNVTQLYGYPVRIPRGPWVPLPDEIPTLPPPLFLPAPPDYNYDGWSLNPIGYLDRALDLLRREIDSVGPDQILR
jgi:hypothetical protein